MLKCRKIQPIVKFTKINPRKIEIKQIAEIVDKDKVIIIICILQEDIEMIYYVRT